MTGSLLKYIIPFASGGKVDVRMPYGLPAGTHHGVLGAQLQGVDNPGDLVHVAPDGRGVVQGELQLLVRACVRSPK